jgi:hypothetical protein
MTATQKQLEAYRSSNVAAARIIASDPAKYPPDSLMGIVARMVLRGDDDIRAELEKRARRERAGQGEQKETSKTKPDNGLARTEPNARQ